jgi:hypothetical protein
VPRTCKRAQSEELKEYEGTKEYKGVYVAQAVSHRLPTAAARDRTQVNSSGNCGGPSGNGAGYLRALRFPLPGFILPTAPNSLSSSGAGTLSQLVAEVQSGLGVTLTQEEGKSCQ